MSAFRTPSVSGELSVIADAIDAIPDSLSIWDGPAWVERRVRELGGSEGAVKLARAVVSMGVRLRGTR